MKTIILVFCSILSNFLFAQSKLINPINGDSVNYTQIMFEFEQMDSANYYQLEIAKGVNFNDKALILKRITTSLAIRIDSSLNFGYNYYWRVKGFNSNGKIIATSNINSFYIKESKWSSNQFLKQEINQSNTKKMHNSLVVYDYGVITDKRGNIIWYLPETDGTFRSLNLNNDGTITYNSAKGSVESNLKGLVYWRAPNIINENIQIKNYHHDFKKLKNGNFLCLAERKTNYETDKLFSVVFEIDKKNTIKWFWDEEPIYRKRNDKVLSSHINAVDLDEDRGILYVSNRNLNSISKIKVGDSSYILNHIGNMENPVFSGQHSVTILPNKNLLLFNNNTSGKDVLNNVSSIIEINRPMPLDTVLKINWEYKFNFAKAEENLCAKSGDVDLLPNGNLMITSGANNRVFEVTKKKEIVWESLSFRRDKIEDIWTPQTSYRTHFCSSLYPNYFTVINLKKLPLIKGKEQFIEFAINNDGSENDEYEISITSSNNCIINNMFLISVLAQKSIKQQFKVNPITDGEIAVTITSKTNRAKVKTLYFRVQ